MSKFIKNVTLVIFIALILVLSMIALTACPPIWGGGNDDDGFTVSLRFRYGEMALSLYDNSLLENPNSTIAAEPLERDLYRVTRYWFGHPEHPDIPSFQHIDSLGGGSNHGIRNSVQSHFFAFTFYLKNHSNRSHNYEARINLIDADKNFDDSLRIVLIRDSIAYGREGNQRVPIVYAKEAATGGLDVYSDRVFLQPDGNRGTIIFFNNIIAPQDLHRFTIIMYIEGWDPETTDYMLGGMIRLAMDFYAF